MVGTPSLTRSKRTSTSDKRQAGVLPSLTLGLHCHGVTPRGIGGPVQARNRVQKTRTAGAMYPCPSHPPPRTGMKWDVFTILEQLLILLTISSQIWIAIRVILNATGAEQYVRIMAFCSGLLLFLISRPLGLTFADLMLLARVQENLISLVLIGGLLPFMIGVLVSEATIIAIQMGNPVPIRFMLMVAAFTLSQAAYTNFMAISTHVTTLDRAYVPNLCYAVAVGIWLTFRYRDAPPK